MTDYEMELTHHDILYDGEGYFEFPNNPHSVIPRGGTKKSIIDIPYKSIVPFLDFGTITPIQLVLTGTMHGSTRDTNFRLFCDKFYSKNLKRFWIDSDHYIYCFGAELRGPSMVGRRNNFNDYVATFLCPIPFWYDKHSGTGTERGFRKYHVTSLPETATTLNDSTSNSTGAFTNANSAPSHIQRIRVILTGGTSITSFKFGDKAVSSSDVAGDNILEWSDATGLAANEVLHLHLLYHVKNKCSKWYYFKTGGGSGGTIAYGTATSGGDNTLTDTSETFTVDTHKDKIINIISGTGSGQYRRILSNTSTVITVTRNWDTNPDSTSVYSIGDDSAPFGTLDMTGDDLEDGPRVKPVTTDQDFSSIMVGGGTATATLDVWFADSEYAK